MCQPGQARKWQEGRMEAVLDGGKVWEGQGEVDPGYKLGPGREGVT